MTPLEIIGNTIRSVSVSEGKDHITFHFQDGYKLIGYVEGDCCSYSWIEHLEIPGDINGSVLLSIQDSDSITQDHSDHDEDKDTYIQVYNTIFRTTKGDIVLEYRNSSNGYYGGSLVLEVEKP